MQRERIAGVGQRFHAFPEQFALDVEQRHAPTLGEKPFGNGKPDATRSAGHQRDFLRGGGHGRSVIECFSKPVGMRSP